MAEQELQAELKNFEEFSRANNMLVRYDTHGSSFVTGVQANERLSGYPNPKLYDQYYINQYSFPKGLQAIYKNDEERENKQAFKQSLYDIKIPNPRRGINGWKLTRRPHDYIMNQAPGQGSIQSPGQRPRKRAKTNAGHRMRS